MTNTINNVPRELLADLLGNDHDKRIMAERHLLAMLANAPSPAGVDADHVEDVRAMVADPSPAGVYSADPLACPGCASGCFRCTSPAGVDGLKRYEVFPYLDDDVAELDICEADDGSFVKYDAAQAIIDGLRGEVAQLQSMLATVSKAGLRVRTERDQQAQRIGELEGLLRHAQKQVPTGSGLHMRIDAALSAVCAAAPNIATTSEHSSQPERDPCPTCIKGGFCNTPTCGRLLAMPKAY